MKRNTLRVFVFGAVASLAAAQTFEVASVKPAAPEGRPAMHGGPGTSDPGQITYTKISLKSLLKKYVAPLDIYRHGTVAPGVIHHM